MKMTTEHFTALKTAIEQFDTPERRQRYRDGKFPNADLVNDLNVRYRWDLFWTAAGVGGRTWASGTYLDAHIDTALRKIVAVL